MTSWKANPEGAAGTAILAVGLLLPGAPVLAFDYPTSERVVFVLECLRDYPGPEFEMVQKCSCALDAIAEKLTYEQFVERSTVSKAVTIAGERGSTLRDNEQAQDEARDFRTLYREARKRCLFRR